MHFVNIVILCYDILDPTDYHAHLSLCPLSPLSDPCSLSPHSCRRPVVPMAGAPQLL